LGILENGVRPEAFVKAFDLNGFVRHKNVKMGYAPAGLRQIVVCAVRPRYQGRSGAHAGNAVRNNH
jgi:hypothetical protein